jgi:hypothetical protein
MQTPQNLISGLWKQLVDGKPLGQLAHSIHSEHFEKGTRPLMDQLQELLHNAIAQWFKVYIIVDALDEYPEDKRQILLKELGSLGATVNVMVTSRPHIELAGVSAHFETMDIHTDLIDIHRYIDARLQNSNQLSNHLKSRPELRDEIHSKIISAGDGM